MTTVQTIGVIGARTMANGIARACVTIGLSDVMIGVDEERIARGVDSVAGSGDRLVKNKGTLALGHLGRKIASPFATGSAYRRSLSFSALSSVAASTMRLVAASARV